MRANEHLAPLLSAQPKQKANESTLRPWMKGRLYFVDYQERVIRQGLERSTEIQRSIFTGTLRELRNFPYIPLDNPNRLLAVHV